MFYLAMILTFLGLSMILIYIVRSSIHRPGMTGSGSGRNRLDLPADTPLPDPLVDESARPTWQLRSRKREAWREDPPRSGGHEKNGSDGGEDVAGQDGVRLRRLETGTTEETLRVKPWAFPAGQKEPTPPLVASGTLYLNRDRNLPLPGTVFQNNIRAFGELKRIGKGTLVLDGGAFLIRCDAANYHYSAGDLDQIIFQNRGLALIPALPDRPVPVFITEQPEVIKEYIKKHARILH